jgi:hypothetical protein
MLPPSLQDITAPGWAAPVVKEPGAVKRAERVERVAVMVE